MSVDDAGRVLIVEDEPRLAAVLGEYLQAAGYRHDWIDDGARAVEAVRTLRPDLVLLDLMLPHRDGVEICRELRGFSDVPVIMVTARADEVDRLLGLEIGADDYVCKPFSPREVIARVNAVLRRHRHAPGMAPMAGLRIDEDAFRASVDGRDLDLTLVEFDRRGQRPERRGQPQQIVVAGRGIGEQLPAEAADRRPRPRRFDEPGGQAGERAFAQAFDDDGGRVHAGIVGAAGSGGKVRGIQPRRARFHGISRSRRAMPQRPLAPANTSPAPMTPDSHSQPGDHSAPSNVPNSTSDPAAICTCRINSSGCFASATVGWPASFQASSPPSSR